MSKRSISSGSPPTSGEDNYKTPPTKKYNNTIESPRAKRIRLGLESPKKELIYEVFDIMYIETTIVNVNNAAARAPKLLNKADNDVLIKRTHEDTITVAFDKYKHNNHDNYFHDEILGIKIASTLKSWASTKITAHVTLTNNHPVHIKGKLSPRDIIAIGYTLRTNKIVLIDTWLNNKLIKYEIIPRHDHINRNVMFANKLDAIHDYLFEERQLRTTESLQTMSTAISAKLMDPPELNIQFNMPVESNAFLYICKMASDDFMDNWLSTKIQLLNITYDGQSGIGAGVTRNFFQSILDGIVSAGIFRRINENSIRHTINHEFVPPPGVSFDRVYWCAGRIMAFALANNMPFVGFRLSHILLDALLYTRTAIPVETITYYSLIDDDPSALKTCTTMLRSGRDINALDLYFEDAPYPPPGPRTNSPHSDAKYDEGAVTHRNVLTLVQRRAFNKLFGPTATQIRTQTMIIRCIDGFSMLYSNDIEIPWLPTGMTMSQLDDLLCISNITPAEIRNSNMQCSINISNTILESKHAHAKDLFNWFIEIISNDDSWRSFPIDTGASSSSSGKKKKDYLKFLEGLIMFWSSARFIMTENNYQVSIINPRGEALPTSNTCFFQINIPVGIKTKAELYNKLVFAVNNVESGVGMYGGAKKNKARQPKK
jgi:hypothetical protein